VVDAHRYIECFSAFFALLAGIAWIRAATVKVKAEHQSGLDAAVVGGFVHFVQHGITYDLHKTMRLQSKWNARAAVLAAFAAVLQAGSLWPSLFS
jgi:DMSO reductase anchor subunit